jgi:hypothetical protein
VSITSKRQQLSVPGNSDVDDAELLLCGGKQSDDVGGVACDDICLAADGQSRDGASVTSVVRDFPSSAPA